MNERLIIKINISCNNTRCSFQPNNLTFRRTIVTDVSKFEKSSFDRRITTRQQTHILRILMITIGMK